MPTIDLRYGSSSIPFEFSEGDFDVLSGEDERLPMTDVEIGAVFDRPINSDPLEHLVEPGQTVLFVVPDATRRAGCGQIINLLVRRLIADGTEPHEMAVIFATGIHRRVTDLEKQEILTPFIAQRVKTLDHDPRDLMQIVRVGETSSGIPIELNRALFDFDHVVLIGSVSFHYFAGFTGGRKLVCPGLASSRTVGATHKLAFDCETLDRRAGVGTGLLEGNPVNEAFVEAAAKAKVMFAVTTMVNSDGDVTDVFCGELTASHRAACDAFAERNTITVREKWDVVIVSCGGYPQDINMIQAHKSLEAASYACNEGGTIILVAECRDGLGRDDFLQWFESKTSNELAKRLCEKYQVNGQTAWSLMKKTERFETRVVTSLDDATCEKLRIKKTDLTSVRSASGYLIPNGSKLRILN